MICGQCQSLGKKLGDTMTFKEKVHLLTAVATMRKYLDANPNTPGQDKEVSSSITTKVLLSIEPGPREELLRMLRQSAGVDIVLKNCPHGFLGVLQ